MTQVSDWHHVKRKLNPANIASRGIIPTDDVKLCERLQEVSFLLTDGYPKETRNTELDTADDEVPSIRATTAENDVLADLIKRHST